MPSARERLRLEVLRTKQRTRVSAFALRFAESRARHPRGNGNDNNGNGNDDGVENQSGIVCILALKSKHTYTKSGMRLYDARNIAPSVRLCKYSVGHCFESSHCPVELKKKKRQEEIVKHIAVVALSQIKSGIHFEKQFALFVERIILY